MHSTLSREMKMKRWSDSIKKIRDLIASMDDEFKPSNKYILVYYIEALNGEIRYQLRDKEPTDLKFAQTLAIKIDAMQTSSKSKLPGFTRGCAKQESKGKELLQEAYDNKIKE